MIRLVVSNQRGGVAKTTTVHTLARYCADRGLRVLIIDTDPQGSVGAVLGLRPKTYLHQFIVPEDRRAVQQPGQPGNRGAVDGPHGP